VNPNLLHAVAAALLLAGCASQPADPTTVDAAMAEEERAAALEQMTTEEKVAIYNEGVEEEKDQLVCRKERKVGTHFPKTVCYTQQEIEEMRRAAQSELGKPKVRQCSGVGGAAACGIATPAGPGP
jgi:hypothetical protein